MAIFKQGLSQNINPVSVSPEGGNSNSISTGRVTDIILSPAHPLFEESGGKIGAITYEAVNIGGTNGGGGSTYAIPLNFHCSTYPVIGEIVCLVSAPSIIEPSKDSMAPYYISPVNIHNAANHNAYPNIDQSTVNNSNEEMIKNNFNSEYDVENNTFIEKSNIQPLLPMMGDTIVEGRNGQSIRMGNTAKNGLNNWSKSGNNSDPIIIIRNGQSKTNTPGFIPITENIRKDLSSIYLTSTQKLEDFKVASELYNSFPKNDEPTPPSQFTSPQIALNSDRIVINSKSDSILLSSQNSISINSKSNVGVDTTSFCISSNDIKLGSNDAKEPILKGDTTVNLLKSLAEAVASLSSILEVENNWPEGKLVSSQNPIAVNASSIINSIVDQLNSDGKDSLKSKTSKVK